MNFDETRTEVQTLGVGVRVEEAKSSHFHTRNCVLEANVGRGFLDDPEGV